MKFSCGNCGATFDTEHDFIEHKCPKQATKT